MAAGGEVRPRDVLEYLRRASSAVAAASDQRNALRALVEEALPALAEEGGLYVVGSDGRLYPRVRVPEPDGRGRPLPRGSLHPAAVACRSGSAAYRVDGEEAPQLFTPDEALEDGEGGEPIVSVAIPLTRDGEAAGALYLCLGDGRHYTLEDVALLVELGHTVSLTLENTRLRREAREARRAKRDFLSVMSHELRTPLTAVVGYADLLEAGIPGPVNQSQQKNLLRIKESAWELLELIDGILGFARYEGEDPDLEVTVVEPRDLVDDAAAVYRSSLKEKGVDLEVQVPANLPAFRTDREKAARILLHLLSNAEKFTTSGTVRVCAEADDDWIVFHVEDTGPGIPPRDMESIFEPFWQGQRPETRRFGGTGLGLSLARRLSALLSGELRVESVEGEGTEAELRLPREGPQATFP